MKDKHGSGGEDQPFIQLKSKGAGIMMSDFITSHDGFLGLSDDELVSVRQTNPDSPACQCALLKCGGDVEGYWTSEKFMNYLRNAADIVNFK